MIQRNLRLLLKKVYLHLKKYFKYYGGVLLILILIISVNYINNKSKKSFNTTIKTEFEIEPELNQIFESINKEDYFHDKIFTYCIEAQTDEYSHSSRDCAYVKENKIVETSYDGDWYERYEYDPEDKVFYDYKDSRKKMNEIAKLKPNHVLCGDNEDENALLGYFAYEGICTVYKDNKEIAKSYDIYGTCNKCNRGDTNARIYDDGTYIYCDSYTDKIDRVCHLIYKDGTELANGEYVSYYPSRETLSYSYCPNGSRNSNGYALCHFIEDGKEVATFDGGERGYKVDFLDFYENGDYSYCNNGTFNKNCYLVRNGKILVKGYYLDEEDYNYGNSANGVQSFSNGYYSYCEKGLSSCYLMDKNGKQIKEGVYFEVYGDGRYEYCIGRETCFLVIDGEEIYLEASIHEPLEITDKDNYSYCIDWDGNCIEVVNGVKKETSEDKDKVSILINEKRYFIYIFPELLEKEESKIFINKFLELIDKSFKISTE